MSTTFKLWIAIICVSIAITTMIINSWIIFSIIFWLIGFVFAILFFNDMKDEEYKIFSDENF